jgi:hypothetical protein
LNRTLNTLMKIECRACGVQKNTTEFFKAADERYFDKICKACKHNAQQSRRIAFKAWCVEYKGGRCVICGYNKCHASLDFHHIDSEKKSFEISGSKRLITKERAIKELDKCVLLCKNCHGEYHAGVTQIPNIQGSSSLA